jgi:hypothetical protein
MASVPDIASNTHKALPKIFYNISVLHTEDTYQDVYERPRGRCSFKHLLMVLKLKRK